MLKIFISLFFLLFTFQANANDKYKTNIDWYSKDQVKYWFNDNFWKRFISKTINTPIIKEEKLMIDIFGRLTACQMMLELEGGFPNVEIMQSCKELFKIYAGKTEYTLLFLDFGEERKKPFISGQTKLYVDNWFNNKWFSNYISKGVPMPEEYVTQEHIDSLRFSLCDAYSMRLFPTFKVKNSCITLFRKYENHNSNAFPYSDKYKKIAEMNEGSLLKDCNLKKDFSLCMKYKLTDKFKHNFPE